MNELELLKTFRQICGEEGSDGFYLTVESNEVPNFIGTDQKFVLPQIIIRPFISQLELGEVDVICESSDDHRSEVELNQARFQVDIYAKDLITLLKIKKELIYRIKDFMDPEMIVFSNDDWWEPFETTSTGVFVDYNYDTSHSIVRMTDPLAVLDKLTTPAEVLGQVGSWCLDDTGLYVNPLNDLQGVEVYKLLNGKILSNGKTAYEAGIQRIRQTLSRKLKDPEPESERWSMDFILSYRTSRDMTLGDKVEEIEING